MASLIYNKGKTEILNGGIDLLNDTIKVALVTSSYTPDKDAHENFGDINSEVSGGGYSSGGNVLTFSDMGGQQNSITQDDSNDRAEFNADDVTWGSSTITARAAVIYKYTGTLANDSLIAYIDFDHDYSTNNEDFTIEWDTEGILALGE